MSAAVTSQQEYEAALARIAAYREQLERADKHADQNSLDRAADLELIYQAMQWVDEMPAPKHQVWRGRPVDPRSRNRFATWVLQQTGLKPSRVAQLHRAHDLVSNYLHSVQVIPDGEGPLRPFERLRKAGYGDRIPEVYKMAVQLVMTALLLWLLAPVIPVSALRLRAAIRNPRRLTFLDRPAPRMLRAPRPYSRPEGPAPHPPVPGAGPLHTPPRAHGGAGEPRTAPSWEAHERGARRLTIPDWLTIPFRLRRTEGDHTHRAVAQRTLIFDELQGRYRHAETGPMELPQRYLDYAGKTAEGWWPS